MCGRTRCTLGPTQVARGFGFPTSTAIAGTAGGADSTAVPTMKLFRPSYNVAPGAYLPVGIVRARPADGAGGRVDGSPAVEGPMIQCMKWGLVPSFTKKTEKPDHFRMFNARSESIKEKASFRRLIPKNRCLVAVEGFYEWKKDGSTKQPYYIHFQDQRPLVFAALFDAWTNSEGEILNTFSILTTRASAALEWLHDRMPVILGDKSSIDAWLNHASVKLEEIIVPYEGADLVWYPVTPAIGKTSFDGPECIKEVQLRSACEKPISKFFTKKSSGNSQSEKPQKASEEFAETHAFRTAKQECHKSADDQLEKTNQQQHVGNQDAPCSVEEDHVTKETQDLQKAESNSMYEGITPLPCNTIGKQDTICMKRQFEDTKPALEMKMKNTGMALGQVNKKEKGIKHASHGQASLLSYFARK